MKRIISTRRTGKSTTLLRMALENHGNIAVFNSRAVETFVVLARDVLHIPEEEIETAYAAGWARIKDVTVASILEYVGITDTRGFNRARPLYIDEIGLCMQSLLRRFKLGGYTESLEEASYENVYREEQTYEEKPKKSEQKYTITLNERQLRLFLRAIENWARLRMGQTWDLADDLAFQNYEHKQGDPEFDKRILRRDACKEMLELAMRAASNGNYQHFQKTEDVEVALDMYSTIRNFFWHQTPVEERENWTTDADPLYLWGPEPKMEIKKVENDG